MFNVRMQAYFNGVLRASEVVQTGLESHGMADFACYLIANKAQSSGNWRGYHLVYSVIESV